jgi:hypothetical protein
LCRARQQVIQGAIDYNEAHDRVKEEFSDELTHQPTKLPPYRPEFDYEVKLKHRFTPIRQSNRSFSLGERAMFAKLEKAEQKHNAVS